VDVATDADTADSACPTGEVACTTCGVTSCYKGEACPPIAVLCIEDTGTPNDAVVTDACPTGSMLCNECGIETCYKGDACPLLPCPADVGPRPDAVAADAACPSGQIECNVCGAIMCSIGGCPAVLCVTDAIVLPN
jgi:hypothetical protein